MTEPEGQSHVASFRDAEPAYLFEILNLSLRMATRSAGISQDEFCDLVGTLAPESLLSPENLRRLSNDRPHTFANSLGIVAALARLGQPELLERLARAAGYTLTPAGDGEGTEAGMLAVASAYQKDVAETLTEVARVLLDGKLTTKQAAKIMRELSEDEQQRASLLRSIQAMLVHVGADA